MLGISEKPHSGWDDIDDKTFFHRSEAYKYEEVVMSTTKDYEECFIMFSTISLIKKTLHSTDKQNKSKIEQSFEIRCAMTHFEVDNREALRRGLLSVRSLYARAGTSCVTLETKKASAAGAAIWQRWRQRGSTSAAAATIWRRWRQRGGGNSGGRMAVVEAAW